MKTHTPLNLFRAGLIAAAMLAVAAQGQALAYGGSRPGKGLVSVTMQQGDGNAPGGQNSANAARPGPGQQSAAPSEPQHVTLPAGVTISVRIADVVDSSRGHAGDLYTGTVDPSVLIRDQVVIPRGTEAHVRMMEDKKGGHLHGKASVALELVSLVMNGQRLGVESGAYTKQKGAAAAKADAVASPSVGAGAEGAADVALAANPAGAVAAPAIAVFRSAKVELPAGTRVEFILASDFTFDKPPAAAAQPDAH